MTENIINEKTISFVHSVARKYAKYCNSYDDLVQEGLLGVLEAQSKYDPDKGTQFSSYALFWIRKRILKFLDKEITYSGASADLNTDILADEKSFGDLSQEKSEVIAEFPDTMSEEEIEIIKYMYEKEMPLSQIAKLKNQRREKVRQKYRKAMRKLRFFMEKKTDQ